MAYCTAAEVAQELGVTFTAGQTTWAGVLIPRAQAFIDRYCGRTFEASTLITDELHLIESPYLYLDRRPISAVTSVEVRSTAVGATSSPLTAGTDYEVLSSADGLVLLSPGWDVVSRPDVPYVGQYALVTYTPAVTVPLDITDACVQIVAARMRPLVTGEASEDVKRYSVGGELTVERFTATEIGARAMNALDLLNSYRKLVLA